jgi:hypothetical protein
MLRRRSLWRQSDELAIVDIDVDERPALGWGRHSQRERRTGGQRIERSEAGALGELLSANFENVCFCWTSQSAQLMSAFAGKADIAQTPSDVCF